MEIKRIAALLLLLGNIAGNCSQNSIRFLVDMNKPIQAGLFAPSEGDEILLRGGFNNWQEPGVILDDRDRDGRFEATFDIEGDSGKAVEYKYVIRKANNIALWEKYPNRENSPYGNRVLLLTGENRELPTDVFNFDRYFLARIGKEVLFTAAELQDDFTQFRRILENEHCCLYEYTGKNEFDSLFERQFRRIDGPMRPDDFFRILVPITAKIGCMHTAIWMSGAYFETNPDNLFPLQIRLLENVMVATGSYREPMEIPRGSIIFDINGRSAVGIVDKLRKVISADAFNPHFVDSQLMARFPVLYASFFGFPASYTVTYKPPGGETRIQKVLTPADIGSVRKAIFSRHNHPPLTLEFVQDGNTAIMTVKTFIYYDRVEYFKHFMDSSFQRIRETGTENLILDLRGNDGGDPFCAVILFSYLQKKSAPYFSEPYGKYSELAKPVPVPENRFTGNLFTLIDGSCGSTNGHFCSLLKYHRLGKFVGTPSGSTYKCNAGKNMEVTMDHSSMILTLGRNTYAAAVEGLDKSNPIMPDLQVRETYRDFLEGRDVFMDAALKLIGNEGGLPR